jgi:Na+/proline symporter
MSVPMVILAVYAVMMTGFWFIALSGAKKAKERYASGGRRLPES